MVPYATSERVMSVDRVIVQCFSVIFCAQKVGSFVVVVVIYLAFLGRTKCWYLRHIYICVDVYVCAHIAIFPSFYVILLLYISPSNLRFSFA